MSWNIQYQTKADFYAKQASSRSSETLPEDQVEVARKAAMTIFESGVVGQDKDYEIYLCGHSNPNHEPHSDYTTDWVQVSIHQRKG